MPVIQRYQVFRATAATVVAVAAVVTPMWGAPTGAAGNTTRIAVIGDSYTAGSDEGGKGSRSWTELAWDLLAQRGVEIDADVAAEGGAGYGHPGDRGRVFEDLTAQAVQRTDALVVFFGSRNDQPVDPQKFPSLAASTPAAISAVSGSARRRMVLAGVIKPGW